MPLSFPQSWLNTSLPTKLNHFVEHQLDYAQIVMYEVVLDDEDLAMELFYALQEGEISFPEVAINTSG